MTRWPWITTIVTLGLAVSPLGLELISNLQSGEALSRSIAGAIVMTIAPILLVLGLLEWLMWRRINAAPNFPPTVPTTISDARKPDKSEA
jgi:hypothetical protein